MEQTFVSKVFLLIAKLLQNIAYLTNLTYNEVNILVYYLVIPLSWCIILDCIIGMPITTLLLIAVWAVIFLKVKSFSEWCDKGFKLSQRFICFFGEYVQYSVIICVLIPLLIYAILIYLLIYNLFLNFLKEIFYDNFLFGRMTLEEEILFLNECRTNKELRQEAVMIALLVKTLKNNKQYEM